MGDLRAHLPIPTECWAVFDQNDMTFVPHPPYSPDLALSDLLVSLDENSPKGWHFADAGEVKQRPAETLKASASMSSVPVLSGGENVSIGIRHQMESTLKVTEV